MEAEEESPERMWLELQSTLLLQSSLRRRQLVVSLTIYLNSRQRLGRVVDLSELNRRIGVHEIVLLLDSLIGSQAGRCVLSIRHSTVNLQWSRRQHWTNLGRILLYIGKIQYRTDNRVEVGISQNHI